MPINKAIKELILNEIKNKRQTVIIPHFVPEDEQLKETYQICRILDGYLLNYFQQQNEKLSLDYIEQKINEILANFKQEVLTVLFKEKDKFRREIKKKKTSFKNIFEFARCENLYLSNLYTRFISENMGHKLEDIAGIANNVILPAQELKINIKGIDLIIYDQDKIHYTQLKTKKDTLTGSQSSRSINELKIHPNPIFAAALDMGNSWTLSKKECEKYKIQRLAGQYFWSLINLDYDLILTKLAKIINQIDKELYL